MNYYERHLGDYARDTGHLSALEHGVYNLLLDHYYATELPIPDDQKYRIARAKSRAEKEAVAFVLKAYFTLENGAWSQGKCERVIAEYRAFIEKQRSSGRASAAKRSLNGGSTVVQPVLNSGCGLVPTKTQPPTSHLPPPSLEEREPAVPDDPRDLIFTLGIQLCGEAHRSLLGKLVKDHGREAVAAKIGEMAAMNPRPIAPHTWLIGCLRPREAKPSRFKTA